MGVERDISIEVPELKEGFETKLRTFIARKNSKMQSWANPELIELHVVQDKNCYDIYFGRTSYSSFLFFLMRLVKIHYETGVKIIFDADGDMMDEHMDIEYTDGKFNVDLTECDTYQLK